MPDSLKTVFDLFDELSNGTINHIDFYKQAFGKHLCSDEARKRSYGIRDLIEVMPDRKDEDYDRQKMRDERMLLNELKRKNYRLERMEDIIKESINKLEPMVPLPVSSEASDERIHHKVALMQISDIHYGLKFDNGFNTYNTDIAKQRLDAFFKNAWHKLEYAKCSKLIICIQGDLISANIRNVIRLQNQEDLIDQIINISEYLCYCINYISSLFSDVEIYFVGGNHERVTPKKEDNQPGENYIKIVKWFMAERLRHHHWIKFGSNEHGYDIESFTIFDQNVVMVHGDSDNLKSVVGDLSSYLHKPLDCILSGHGHTPNFADIQGCRVIVNGCVCGDDEYSKSLRLTSRPSQNLCVFHENGDIDFMPILL